ncbi:MAG: hypothetical protein ACYC2T_02070 [Bacillota bacterium]
MERSTPQIVLSGVSMVISFIVSVIGFRYILNAANWGNEAANKFLQAQGGSMGSEFSLILQEKIIAYRLTGTILLSLGGLGLLLYSIIKQKDLIEIAKRIFTRLSKPEGI